MVLTDFTRGKAAQLSSEVAQYAILGKRMTSRFLIFLVHKTQDYDTLRQAVRRKEHGKLVSRTKLALECVYSVYRQWSGQLNQLS